MAWQYHPVIVLFFLGGLVALGVAVYCFEYVRRHGFSYLVGALGLFGLHNAVWAFAAALKTANTDLPAKLLFYKLQFLGSGVTPMLAVVVALGFVGWDRWLTRRTFALLAVFPSVVIPLVIVNPQGAVIAEPVLVRAQGILALEHAFPPLFALVLAAGLGAATLAAAIIAYEAGKRTVPWRPALLAVLVFMLPVVVISLKIGGVYPPGGEGINVTPAVNAIALSLLAVAIIRYRVFELLPVGRDHAVEVMPDGYLLVGPDETVLDANPAATDLLTAAPDAGPVHDSVRDHVPVFDAVTGPEADKRAEFSHRGRTIEVRSSPVSRQHQTAGQLLLLQDVTETRERERALERTNKRLDEFACVVTHDLRNPLTVAKARIELARDGDAGEHLSTAETALTRMETLIDEVLTLARQGQPVSATDPIELSAVADRSWAVVDTPEAILSVESDLTVMAAGDRLQRLFENLFRNAIDHGGSAVTIEIGALEAEPGFYVADDGEGIPADERDRVFDYGYSTHDDGTGYGLAIVAEIAEAHGWAVEVTDGADGGARFEVTGVDIVA